MDANEFKQALSVNDIYSLLESINAEPFISPSNKNIINCKTICHDGDGHNLRYYADTFSFHCYSHCGTLSIYDLISKVYDIQFFDSFKFVLSYFNYSISDMNITKSSYVDENDMSFFNRWEKDKEHQYLSSIDKSVLNTYYNQYYKGWIDEGISIQSMVKFNIKHNLKDKQIIIPHYDEFDNLVGVRCRNLDKELVNEGKKYMPVYINNQLMNHPTGSVLYGLNFNKDDINKIKKVILFESEKAVLQLDTMMPNMSIGVCLSGSNLTNNQVNILNSLNVNEVIIALDKEFDDIGTVEEEFYASKIQSSIVNKITSFFNVSIIWDLENDLETKMSPTDAGPAVFKKLLNNRILLN